MQQKEFQLGHIIFTPYFTINKDKKTIPIYFIEDAVSPEARTGVKAGNSILDKINRELQLEQIIKDVELEESLKDIK